MNKLLVLIFTIIFNSGFCQGVGSMTWNYKNDSYEMNMLVWLKFNDKIYAVRHTNLPQKRFQFGTPTTEGYINVGSMIRPVEIFVSKDSAKTWNLAHPNPIFESVSSGGQIEMDLNLIKVERHAKMVKLSDHYFVLATRYRMKVAGQTAHAYYPIIFLFKESTRDGSYPIEFYDTFQPMPENQNEVGNIQISGKKVTFNLSNGKKVFLTFDPEPNYEIKWEDSDGNFTMRGH